MEPISLIFAGYKNSKTWTEKPDGMLKMIAGWILLALAAATPVAAAVRHGPTESYIVLAYHDIPKNGQRVGPFDRMAVSRGNFGDHLDWLTSNGYHFISVQQIVDAHAHKSVLPAKAVLLTFDDGFESFYTRVFPILKARHIPAVEAVIGTWMAHTERPDVPGNKPVLTWAQVREMQASGLVEIASHTFDMHNEVDADPQGETHAAVTTREFLETAGRYESDAEYAARLRTGMIKSADFIADATGTRPRVMVWPFGEYNDLAVAAARGAGMPITLGLSDGANDARADVSVIKRLLVADDPEVPAFAAMVESLRADRPQRAIRIDLDSLWSLSAARQDHNIQAAIGRIERSGATAVYLQAYADPDRNGVAGALYFPNRHLPVRADLLSAVTERIKEATGVKIYALMPARVITAGPKRADLLRPWLGDIYEDLGKYVAIDGLVLSGHDNLVFAPEPDNAGSECRGKCLSLSFAATPNDLTMRVRTYRPFIKTAIEIRSPASAMMAQHVFDRSLPRHLRAFDYVVVDSTAARGGSGRLARLVAKVDRRVGRLDRVVFELAPPHLTRGAAQISLLQSEIRSMLRLGARNIAFDTGLQSYRDRQLAQLSKVFAVHREP